MEPHAVEDIDIRCIQVIAKLKEIPADSIGIDDTFEQLNIDSLDKVNICFEIEDMFSIEIPDEALGGVRTIRDMIDGIKSKGNNLSAA
jgi:acyl carrier protein